MYFNQHPVQMKCHALSCESTVGNVDRNVKWLRGCGTRGAGVICGSLEQGATGHPQP